MIVGFGNRQTQRFANGERIRQFQGFADAAARKLARLDQARTLDDLRYPPGNRLELLVGDRAGQYSIRINQQWRICFVWTERGPDQVEIVDYH